MTLYEILGLTPEATDAEIKAAHRRAVKTHHPDAGGNPRRFQQAQRAYDILSDPERRARYDATGTEEDPIAVTEAQRAQSAISAQIVQFINSADDLNSTDIVAAIRTAFMRQRTTHEEACNVIDRRLKRVDILRNRLQRKDDSEGALPALLGERERDLKNAKSKEESQIGVLDQALTMLKDYSYRLDPSPTEEAQIWRALRTQSKPV
jgi:curved DNA-binding protein CbpA